MKRHQPSITFVDLADELGDTLRVTVKRGAGAKPKRYVHFEPTIAEHRDLRLSVRQAAKLVDYLEQRIPNLRATPLALPPRPWTES